MQDFEAVEIIGRATRLVVLTGPGDAVEGLSRVSGSGTTTGVWMFGFPAEPSSLAAEGYAVEG